MSKRIDDRIAREICEFVTDELYYTVRRGYSILKSEWSPSTNIAHAIEALECLPNELFFWALNKYLTRPKYSCTVFLPFRPYADASIVSTVGKTQCSAICRALLDKRVLAAVKMAKKGKAVRK